MTSVMQLPILVSLEHEVTEEECELLCSAAEKAFPGSPPKNWAKMVLLREARKELRRPEPPPSPPHGEEHQYLIPEAVHTHE